MITCNTCNIPKNETEFSFRDRYIGTRRSVCKYCVAKNNGIKEIGKHQRVADLLAKGMKRCTDCKDDLPLDKFSKNKTDNSGYSAVCYQCSKKRVRKYQIEGKKKLGTHYLKRFAIENYGVKHEDITDEILEIAKLHIQAKRSLRYYLDGLEFKTLEAFADYVEMKYGVGVHAVKRRIYSGRTELECTIPEYDFRSQFGCKSRGKIKVTNIDTNEVTIYTSLQVVINKLNIGNEVANRCLKTGEVRKPYKNSTNKQTFKIEHYAN